MFQQSLSKVYKLLDIGLKLISFKLFDYNHSIDETSDHTDTKTSYSKVPIKRCLFEQTLDQVQWTSKFVYGEVCRLYTVYYTLCNYTHFNK